MIAPTRLLNNPLLRRLVHDPFLRLWLILATAIVVLLNIPFHPDFSAGQTITAKFLAGKRPYLDIIENNPPMTFYMHVPSAVLEQWTGLRGEYWQDILAFALCLCVIGLGEWLRTGYAVPRDAASARRVGIYAITLLIMPMTSFGSRDQLTFVLMWPILALYSEDMVKPRTHPAWVDAVIGLMAGLGVCIKFYFVLGPMFGCLFLCLSKRSIKPLFGLENIMAALLCVAYLASVKLLHPAYFEWMYPILLDAYFAGHPTLIYILWNGLLVLTTLYLLIVLARDDKRLHDPRTKLLLAAGFGCSVAYFAFTRNLPFRYLPPASCLLMALAAAQNHSERPTIIKLYEAVFLAMCAWFMLVSNPNRAEATAFGLSLKLDRPNVLLLSGDLGDGHPLIRDLGGRLVNPGLNPWVTLGLMVKMEDPTTHEQRMRFARLIEWERDLTARATEKTPPDLILVQNMHYVNWLAWARMNVSMDNMLRGYKSIGKADNLIFLVRRTPDEMAGVPARSELVD